MPSLRSSSTVEQHNPRDNDVEPVAPPAEGVNGEGDPPAVADGVGQAVGGPRVDVGHAGGDAGLLEQHAHLAEYLPLGAVGEDVLTARPALAVAYSCGAFPGSTTCV